MSKQFFWRGDALLYVTPSLGTEMTPVFGCDGFISVSDLSIIFSDNYPNCIKWLRLQLIFMCYGKCLAKPHLSTCVSAASFSIAQ